MPGRGRRPEDLDHEQPIELIEPLDDLGGIGEPIASGRDDESAPSRVIGLVAALVAVLAVWALAMDRSDTAPPPTTPPPAPEEPEPELPAPTVSDGPGLRWERIMWNIGTNDFRWIDGSFVGDDGTTEWRVVPSIIGPTIGQRQSVLVERPGYRIVDAHGARVLAPDLDQPDHLLFLDGDDTEVRVDLPVTPGVTELVVRVDQIQAAVSGTTAVVAVQQQDRVDQAALSERIGRPLDDLLAVRVFDDRLSILVDGASPGDPAQAVDVSYDDVSFTATERAALAAHRDSVELFAVDLTDGSIGPAGFVPDAIESLSAAGDRFVLEWFTSTPPAFVSTSTTGRSWSPPRDL